MWPFLSPTLEVLTFCLRGWCMLGVFLLPAFTRLGHDSQDRLSPCNGMHVYMESEPMFTPREISLLLEKFSSKEDRTHDAASSQTASPTHFQ